MTPNARNEAADAQIGEMFRNRNQQQPRIIPVEEAQAVRTAVLDQLNHNTAAPKPEAKPAPKAPEPRPAPRAAAPAELEPPKEKAVTAYWEPCGEEARRQHRWKAFGILALMLTGVISLFWWALRSGDATVRLACPVIIACHLAMGVALLWAWLGR